MTTRRTTRWNVALVVALLTSGTGVLVEDSSLLLLSIPAVVFAVYSHVSAVPETTLALERSIAETDPSHDQTVEVTVTLRNTGDRLLPDISIADGVPPMLPVERGSPRHATVLGPGDETSFSYTLVAKRGVHRFDPATVALRDASGSVAVETTLTTATALACRSPVRSLPVDPLEHRHAGSTVTTDGGSGVTFSGVRSYRPGDPPTRIDWNRYARDGDLRTVRFRDDRSRTTVLCLDARDRCYRSSGRDEPHAVWYERVLARELIEAAGDATEPIGLAVVAGEPTWIAPSAGRHHVATLRRTLADRDALPLEPATRVNGRPADPRTQVRPLRTRIERGTTVLLLSPLLDEFPLETARTLRADGHPVIVLSPDVTTTGSRGTDVAQLQRENRIAALRRATVPVVDWHPDMALETAIRTGVRR